MIEPQSAIIAGFVAKLPPDRREQFEERAAIREFDGGQKRADAERSALAEITREMTDAAA